jgi:hypothetical protein
MSNRRDPFSHDFVATLDWTLDGCSGGLLNSRGPKFSGNPVQILEVTNVRAVGTGEDKRIAATDLTALYQTVLKSFCLDLKAGAEEIVYIQARH